MFSALAFATGGIDGYAGGDGGQTDTESLRGWLGYAGLPGGDFDETYRGGAGGSGEHIRLNSEENYYKYRASGGGGGGAAYGRPGGDGLPGYITEDDESGIDVYFGSGGTGATAQPPPQAFYGCGGQGGNGGGAGGNAGGGYSDTYFKVFNDKFEFGDPGAGGHGSVGGQGGAGCVIIYY